MRMNRDPRHNDPSVLDSALADAAYGPDHIAVLDDVLATACRQAAFTTPLNEGVRTLLAAAILEGTLLGLREPEELTSFALRALPSFRKRTMQDDAANHR